MVALIKGSPYVAISAGQVSNHPCPCLKIERTNDVKADAGCSTLFRVSLSRQRRSGPVAMLELSRLFELAGGTRGMTDRPFDLERALPPLVSCPPAPFSLSLSLSIYLAPRFPPPSRNSLENLSGGRCLYAAKINSKRAQKKIPRLYSPANRSSRSLALRSISLSSSPPSSYRYSSLALAQRTTDPIVLCPFSLARPARSLPRKRDAIIRVLASLKSLSDYIVFSCCASARSLPPSSSFLSCKSFKTRIPKETLGSRIRYDKIISNLEKEGGGRRNRRIFHL